MHISVTVHRLAKRSAPGEPYHSESTSDHPPQPSAIGSSGAGMKSNTVQSTGIWRVARLAESRPPCYNGRKRSSARLCPTLLLRLSDQVIKSLSRPELAILRYAYENTEALLEMSIQELSCHVDYSPATILRFCKKLGYPGFAEFKYALRAELRERGGQEAAASGGHGFSIGVSINTMRSNLEATAKMVHEEQLDQVFSYLDSGCPILLWSPGG